MQRGYVTRNVATLVDAPSVSQAEIEPLSLDEAQRIIELAARRRNGTRWSVALALGLRQGEALGLRRRAQAHRTQIRQERPYDRALPAAGGGSPGTPRRPA